MEFRPEITKEFIYNNSQGDNIHYHIRPYTLYDFFTKTSNKKKIPDYQRPYSWEKSNVEDFLFDILDTMLGVKTKDSWFLGCIYVTKESDSQDVAEVLDGQQRLTTLQIIFNELLLTQYSDSSLNINAGLKNSIDCIKECLYYKETGKRKVRFSTDPLTDELLKKYLEGSENVDDVETYKKFIKKFDEELSQTISESKSHKTLYDNIKIVRSFLNTKIINPKKIFIQKEELEKHEISERLEFFANTILYRLWLINIPLIQDNISEELFESLNNRGKPLSMIDKFQFKSLTKGFDKSKEIRNKWSKIFKLIDKLQSSAVNISFIKSDEELIKMYFESKLGSEIDKGNYLVIFESECLQSYESLNKFFDDIIRISNFFIDISTPETSTFIKSFTKEKSDKKVKAITQLLLLFLNQYKNPIRLVFSLLTKYNYDDNDKHIVIQGIWEILKLSYYKNIIIGELGNKIRSDFNLYIKEILNKEPSNFVGLFYKLYRIGNSGQENPFYNMAEDHPSSFQFDNIDFPKSSEGKIKHVSSLDSNSSLLNTTDNSDSTLVLLLYVLLNEYTSFEYYSASAFKAKNLEHVFPRAYQTYWKDKTYKKTDCESFVEKIPNEVFLKKIKNALNDDFELREYKTVPYQQSHCLIEWIGNKLLINDLANKKIGNRNYKTKFKKYENEQFVLPNIASKNLKLQDSTNFEYKTIISRSITIVDKISESLLCNWDDIE